MQHHDPRTKNPESPSPRDGAPRRDDDRESPARHAASIRDLPTVQSSSPRKYYEF